MSGTTEAVKPTLVLGYTGAGKTTVGRMIAKLEGGRCIDTSAMIIRDYAREMGESAWWITFRKRRRRESLFRWGRMGAVGDGPDVWVRMAIEEGATVVAGIRAVDELWAAKDCAKRIVWVVRRGVQHGPTDMILWDDAVRAANAAGVPLELIENNDSAPFWRRRLRGQVAERLGVRA